MTTRPPKAGIPHCPNICYLENVSELVIQTHNLNLGTEWTRLARGRLQWLKRHRRSLLTHITAIAGTWPELHKATTLERQAVFKDITDGRCLSPFRLLYQNATDWVACK